jgi:dTDP-glucose 4,6-dehydratase
MILVTGALGRIGEHLTARLVKSHDVVGADLLTGYQDGYRRVDITSREEIEEVLTDEQPELVIHMAGEVGRLNGELHPERMIRTNALGTLNLAKACAAREIRMINFSTSEVYGDSFEFHLPVLEQESLNAFGNSNIYSISKMFGEAIVKHYVENYGLKAITVRPFMVYGEGEVPSKYRSALTQFVHGALTGQRFDVHRGTSRAWCHVDDFIDGLSLLLYHKPEGYEVFNIGSEENHEMIEAARIVCEEVPASESLINVIPPPARFGTPVKFASIEKMKALGYSPKISLREGIRRVIDWQRQLV